VSSPALGEFEFVVLVAILRLGDNAYGLTIRREIAACTDREPAPGAVYTTLDRLEEKGLVSSRYRDATEARGGRPKRFFRLSATGLKTVTETHRTLTRLFDGVLLPGGAHA
jgi:DNA-binding PadR family transcriptional regulator